MILPVRRSTLCIALFAILLAALAPALNALAARPVTAPPWQEVCTVAGVVSVPGGDEAPDKIMPAGHCLWCKLHPQIGIPSAPVGFSRIPLAADPSPPLYDDPPLFRAPDHYPALPRAPPAIS